MQTDVPLTLLNAEAFGQAYHTGILLTVGALRSLGLSLELAQEVAQAAWVRGWERRAQLREPDLVVNWITSIAFNLYYTGRRHPWSPLGQDTPVPPTQVLDAIEAQQLLGLCSLEDRHLLQWHYIEGWSMKEIAKRLGGCRSSAVRLAVFRAKSRLQGRNIQRRPHASNSISLTDSHI